MESCRSLMETTPPKTTPGGSRNLLSSWALRMTCKLTLAGGPQLSTLYAGSSSPDIETYCSVLRAPWNRKKFRLFQKDPTRKPEKFKVLPLAFKDIVYLGPNNWKPGRPSSCCTPQQSYTKGSIRKRLREASWSMVMHLYLGYEAPPWWSW